MQVDLLSRLHSPYLVQLLGYCADQHHRLLIFEYMPNGSLQNLLHSSPNNLNWALRLRIALDCARALENLHEHTTPSVIHRDFKCSNILLDDNFRAKVSDFGLAKIGSEKINGLISTRVLGTTGYLAPEWVLIHFNQNSIFFLQDNKHIPTKKCIHSCMHAHGKFIRSLSTLSFSLVFSKDMAKGTIHLTRTEFKFVVLSPFLDDCIIHFSFG